jgi:hypothetical protein
MYAAEITGASTLLATTDNTATDAKAVATVDACERCINRYIYQMLEL